MKLNAGQTVNPEAKPGSEPDAKDDLKTLPMQELQARLETSPGGITQVYLKLSVAGHRTIFPNRTTRARGPFWSIRPAGILWVAVAGLQSGPRSFTGTEAVMTVWRFRTGIRRRKKSEKMNPKHDPTRTTRRAGTKGLPC